MLTAALFLGVLAPACPGLADDADLVSVVPKEATMVIGADVDAIAATPFWADIEPALRADLGVGQALQVAERCGLSLDRIYEVVAARDAGDGRLIVARGNEIGRPERLRCIDEQLRARSDGVAPFVVEKNACFEVRNSTGGVPTLVVALNRYTLVVARGSFMEPVLQRLEGRARLGVPPDLAPALARIDRKASAWFVAELGEQERARSFPFVSGADFLGAEVVLDTGIHLTLGVRTLGVEELVTTKELLIGAILRLGARIAEHGVDLELAEDPTVTIEEPWVGTKLAISRAELLRLRNALSKAVRGRGIF